MHKERPTHTLFPPDEAALIDRLASQDYSLAIPAAQQKLGDLAVHYEREAAPTTEEAIMRSGARFRGYLYGGSLATAGIVAGALEGIIIGVAVTGLNEAHLFYENRHRRLADARATRLRAHVAALANRNSQVSEGENA